MEPDHQCLPAQLTVTDFKRSLVVGQDHGEVCRPAWEHKQQTTEVKYLCNQTSSCARLSVLGPQLLNFKLDNIPLISIPRSQRLKYPQLHPRVGQLFNISTKVSSSLSVKSPMCLVQISADTVMVVAEVVMMVRLGRDLEMVALPPLSSPRKFHSCSLLPSGAVLVAGGRGVWTDQLVSQTEIMDIGRGNLQWERSADLGKKYSQLRQ